MTQEEMERPIHILVDNQAKFYANLELLKANVQSIADNKRHTD
jgi:hypothetical protein